MYLCTCAQKGEGKFKMTIKKKAIAFICMMVTMIMVSTMAFATTKDEYSTVNAGNYRKTYTGTSSEFVARSYEVNTVYSTLKNTSTSTKYFVCQIREFTANVGWTANKTVQQNTLPEVQLEAIYKERDSDMTGYYYHHGICYANSYSGQVIDSYTYKACQYYTIH